MGETWTDLGKRMNYEDKLEKKMDKYRKLIGSMMHFSGQSSRWVISVYVSINGIPFSLVIFISINLVQMSRHNGGCRYSTWGMIRGGWNV